MKKSQFGLAERWMQMQPNGQHGCITIISYLMKMIMYNRLKSIQWILLQLFYSEKDMPIKQLLLNLMHIISLLKLSSTHQTSAECEIRGRDKFSQLDTFH